MSIILSSVRRLAPPLPHGVECCLARTDTSGTLVIPLVSVVMTNAALLSRRTHVTAPKGKARFVSMNVSPEARDAINRIAALVGGHPDVAARVPMSPAIIAALQVAEQHLADVAARYLANQVAEPEGEHS